MTLKSTLRPGGRLDTLNPYLYAFHYFFQRFSWDVQPRSWVNRRKLKKMKNLHLGKKAVILCNGPSLLDVDFESLSDVYTFGLNKINLLFDQTEFRPSCVVAVNPFVLEQNSDFYKSTQIPLFLVYDALEKGIPIRNNVTILKSCNIPFFSRDCSMSIFEGFTVTYVAMQLAYHMGFEEVALVGCDHNFSGVSDPNVLLEAEQEDLSHFSKSYFSKGQLWQYPDLRQSEIYYALAKHVYESNGRTLCNASSRTKLDVLPKVVLDGFLQV